MSSFDLWWVASRDAALFTKPRDGSALATAQVNVGPASLSHVCAQGHCILRRPLDLRRDAAPIDLCKDTAPIDLYRAQHTTPTRPEQTDDRSWTHDDEGLNERVRELEVGGVVPEVERLLDGAERDGAEMQRDEERLRANRLHTQRAGRDTCVSRDVIGPCSHVD